MFVELPEVQQTFVIHQYLQLDLLIVDCLKTRNKFCSFIFFTSSCIAVFTPFYIYSQYLWYNSYSLLQEYIEILSRRK